MQSLAIYVTDKKEVTTLQQKVQLIDLEIQLTYKSLLAYVMQQHLWLMLYQILQLWHLYIALVSLSCFYLFFLSTQDDVANTLTAFISQFGCHKNNKGSCIAEQQTGVLDDLQDSFVRTISNLFLCLVYGNVVLTWTI